MFLKVMSYVHYLDYEFMDSRSKRFSRPIFSFLFSVSVVACNEYAANVVFSILCCRIHHNYVDSVKGLHNLINLLIKVHQSVWLTS